MVRILDQEDSLVSHYLMRLRDVKIQQNRAEFRRNVERIGEIMAYEISKELEYNDLLVQTALATARTRVLKEQPVIATILRAGLTLFQGFINYFDEADTMFLGAYRKHTKDGDFKIEANYLAGASLEDRILILTDPMLATGRSLVEGMQLMLQNGNPKKVFIASVVASPQGVEYLTKHFPMPCSIFTASLDEGLNPKAYIVPGLGDAGDLSFGHKL
jgi:uracil phosphoribosyltransferase